MLKIWYIKYIDSWYIKYIDSWCIADTLIYSIFWLSTYYWYFELFNTSMFYILMILKTSGISRVDILLVLWDSKYFDSWRIVDTCDIFNISIIDVLLILWLIQKNLSWRIVNTLRYSIFWWSTYCWYFELFSISMFYILMMTSKHPVFRVFWWSTYCKYFEVYSVFQWLKYCW